MFKYLVLSLVLSLVLTIFSYAEYYGSDILIGGTATADNEAGGAASNACDDNEATEWYRIVDPLGSCWWKYDLGLGVTKTVRKLRIKPSGGVGEVGVKDFKLQGSNNDSDWTDIYTGQHANDFNWEDYTFSNPSAYRYYKLVILSNWRTDGYVQVYEIEMMGLFNFTCEGSDYPVLSTTESDIKQVALGLRIQTTDNANVTVLPVDIVEGTSGVIDYISKISVYLDADEDEIIDDGETLLGSTTSITLDNLVSLSGLNINNTTKYVLIALDFDTTGISDTYNYRLKIPQSEITATNADSGLPITSSSTDVLSNVHSITYGTYSATVSYNGITSASWTSLASQTVKVLDFNVTTADNLTFNSFIVTVTEQNLLDNFTSLTLYKDTNDDGLTDGETAIEQITTFASDEITFSPGATISDTTDRYLIELVTSGSSAGTSSENQTFSFKADPVSFDLTQNSITASISGSSMLNGLSCAFTAPTAVAATTTTTTTTPSSTTDDFTITDALVGSAVAGAAAAVEVGLQEGR